MSVARNSLALCLLLTGLLPAGQAAAQDAAPATMATARGLSPALA